MSNLVFSHKIKTFDIILICFSKLNIQFISTKQLKSNLKYENKIQFISINKVAFLYNLTQFFYNIKMQRNLSQNEYLNSNQNSSLHEKQLLFEMIKEITAKFSQVCQILCITGQNQRIMSQRFDQNQNSIATQLNSLMYMTKRNNMEASSKFTNLDAPRISSHQQSSQQKLKVKRQKQINQWLAKTCGQIFSNGYNLYLQSKLNFTKTKIFCSQNFVRNLMNFNRTNELSFEDYKLIGESMKQKILPYYKEKYPPSEEQTNKDLNNDIQEMDNTQKTQLNLMNSWIKQFSYRESGKYRDVIMKFINEVIRIPDQSVRIKLKKEVNIKPQDLNKKCLQENNLQPLHQNESKVFCFYQKIMTNTFKMVSQKKLMQDSIQNNTKQLQRRVFQRQILKKNNQQDNLLLQTIKKDEINTLTDSKQNVQIKQEQKLYSDQVKQYTKFSIQKKLDNLSPFTQEQIQSQMMQINNSSLLRILTKWCKQLQKKFQSNYYVKSSEPFLMLDGKLNYLNYKQRQILDKLLDEKYKQVKAKLQQLNCNFYYCQHTLSYNFLAEDDQSCIEEMQKVSCKFSKKMAYLLTQHLTDYLNILIDALLSIPSEFLKTKNLKANKSLIRQLQIQSLSPFLLTFKIGDLMRCKCISKQKEIMKVFKILQQFSRKNSQNFKIIKIQNRLEKGTKDISINAQLFGKYICQIQLAISQTKEDKKQKLNNFNHFLYELERSTFGPLIQMCNIWSNKDLRFRKIKLIQDLKLNLNVSNILRKTTHLKQIKKVGQAQKLQQLNDDKDGEYGFFIYKYGKKEIVRAFKYFYIQKMFYLFIVNKDGNIILHKTYDQQSVEQFYRNNQFQIVKHPCEQHQKLKDLNKQYITTEYIMAKKIQKINLQQKSSISIQGFKINFSDIEKHFCKQKNSLKDSSSIITKSNMSNVKFSSFSHIINFMPNLELGIFNLVQIQNIGVISTDWKHSNIKILQISQSQLRFVPEQIYNMVNLKTLKLDNNHIEQLSENIQNLNNLSQLKINRNKLKNLPQRFGYLKWLNFLQVSQNGLQNLPSSFTSLKSLKWLSIQHNQLKKLPENIGLLISLEQLLIYGNPLQILPESFKNLTSLTHLKISNNKLIILPSHFESLKKLQFLQIQNDVVNNSFNTQQFQDIKGFSIISIPFQLSQTFGQLSNLIDVKLSNRGIKTLPKNIGNLTSLKSLCLQNNKLQFLPQSIGKLKTLIELNIQKNILLHLPESFCQLSALKYLNLKSNKLKILPEGFGNLSVLTQLHIQQNQLIQLPYTFGLLGKLEQLYLSDNRLQTLPLNFVNLGQLTKLQINKNKLNCLPQNIGQLKGLCIMQLESNNLRALPQKFGYLSSLKRLKINFNKISSLSQSFGKLYSLNQLQMMNNNLQSFPQSFKELRALQRLFIKKNLFQSRPYIGDQIKLQQTDIQQWYYKSYKVQYIKTHVSAEQIVVKEGQKPILKLSKSVQNLAKNKVNFIISPRI